ncbi:hypothetical protein V7111_14720 [Neobacillus niacini]|uniref:hypothetical protein n=1 Tax=Neobacillus niacini TaxID=86668 RepID=UPI0030030549
MSTTLKSLMSKNWMKKVPFKLKIMGKYFLSNKDDHPILSKHEEKIIVALAADYVTLVTLPSPMHK